jgi:predicted nucleic acid-binding protein
MPLLAELSDIVGSTKFGKKIEGLTPAGLVDDLRKLAVMEAPTPVPSVMPTYPDDDRELAAALAGHADLIASGDKRDLLPLASYQGIEIVAAREAIERIDGVSTFKPL